MNQYKCTSVNCNTSANDPDTIIEHINISHTNEPIFNFECVNRLPVKCYRRYITVEGLSKHIRLCHPKSDDLSKRKVTKCDHCEMIPS
jgi:hypothetical protein